MGFDLSTAMDVEQPKAATGFDLSTARDFESTPGGAATGNPNLERQGINARRTTFDQFRPVSDIAGATGLGAAAGYFGREILKYGGSALAPLPGPIGTVGKYAQTIGNTMEAGSRAAQAGAGALSGFASESAGQAAEQMGAGEGAAFAARAAGGAVGPEVVTGGLNILKLAVKAPALSIARKIQKEWAKQLIDKIERSAGRMTLTEREEAFIVGLEADLRGAPQSQRGQDLEALGTTLKGEAAALNKTGADAVSLAEREVAAAKPESSGPLYQNLEQIGKTLRDKYIAPAFNAARAARSAEYAANEKARDQIVSAREAGGQYINSMPEYKALIDDLESQLKPGTRGADFQNGIRKLLSQLKTGTVDGDERIVLSGKDLNLVKTKKEIPVTFKSIDDTRRLIGEIFKGKPAEGYEALNADVRRDIYARLSDIQKKYAGGENGPQAKLLHDYALSSDELSPFLSKTGRKATAIDKFNPEEYSTDASKLPKAYFQSKESVNSLIQLTRNPSAVKEAGEAFARREISTLDNSNAVRSWMTKNEQWLSHPALKSARDIVIKRANLMEQSEQSLQRATAFAKDVSTKATLLEGKSFPAQRAVDLILSKNEKLWETVGPVIAKSPEAKKKTLAAIRHVLADKARQGETVDLFQFSLRPAMEKSGIATKETLDFIEDKLVKIMASDVPDEAKIGLANRMLIQSISGVTSGFTSSQINTGIGDVLRIPTESKNYSYGQTP